MTLTRLLLPYAVEQHGFITTADAREAGLTAMALVMAARRGTIERIDWGIYRIPELGGDPLARFQEALLRFPGAILTEDTALELWELADVNPRRIRVALPRKVRVRKAVPAWVELVRTTIEPEDITYHEGLAITTPGRAIVEAIRAGTPRRFVDQAIESARVRNLLSSRDERAIDELLKTRRRASRPTDP